MYPLYFFLLLVDVDVLVCSWVVGRQVSNLYSNISRKTKFSILFLQFFFMFEIFENKRKKKTAKTHERTCG